MIKKPELAADEFRDLTKQRYLISKYTHTSYNDTGELSRLEREYILNFISEDLTKQNEAYQKSIENTQGRKR